MTPTPSIPVSSRIRSAIALSGHTTIRSWAKEKRLPEKTVYAVIAGGRTGTRSPKVTKAIERLLK